jgi:hypothetical protein
MPALDYMRAHGNTPLPTERPVAAGMVDGGIASVLAAILLWKTGAINSMAAALDLSPWVIVCLQLTGMTLAGGLYGRIFQRAADDRRGGWLFGLGFGFITWMLGPITLLQWILYKPLATGVAAAGLMGAHLVYGSVLGYLHPWVHDWLVGLRGNGKRRLKAGSGSGLEAATQRT